MFLLFRRDMPPFGVSAHLVGGLWGGDGGGAEADEAYSGAVSRASCVVVAKRWAATRWGQSPPQTTTKGLGTAACHEP